MKKPETDGSVRNEASFGLIDEITLLLRLISAECITERNKNLHPLKIETKCLTKVVFPVPADPLIIKTEESLKPIFKKLILSLSTTFSSK